MKRCVKFIGFLLSSLLIIEILPLSSFAQNIASRNEIKEFKVENTETISPIEREIESERGKHKKVYEREDGTFTAYITDEPVHYYDSGKWCEIDNSLIENNGTITNRSNSYNISLPCELNDSSEIKIDNANSSLSFILNNIESTEATVKNENTDSHHTLIVKNSKVEYKEIAQGADLIYSVSSDSVKESIVLNLNPADKISLNYTLKTQGGELRLNKDNSISFVNNDGLIMKIQSPYMFDNKDNYSEKIETELNKKGDNTYTLVYSPDYAWLSSASYPVTIDPTVNIFSQNAITGTMAGSSSASTEELDNSFFTENTDGCNSEVYLKYENNFLSGENKNVVVTNAELSAYCRAINSEDRIAVYGLTGSWDENTTSQVLSDNKIYDFNLIGKTDDFNRYTWNITEIAHKWSMGLIQNYGVALKALNDNDCKTQIIRPLSSVYTSQRPWFTIDYLLIDNNESREFESIDMGRAGTLYLDKYAGSYYLERTDLALSGNIMSAQSSFVYNPWGYVNDVNSWFGAFWQAADYGKLFYKGLQTFGGDQRNTYTQ